MYSPDSCHSGAAHGHQEDYKAAGLQGPNQHIQSAGGSNVSERIPGPEALRALLTSPAPHQATGPHYPPADPGYSGSEKLGVPQAAAHRHDNSRNYQAGHAAQQQGQQGRELGQQSTFISRQLFEVGAGMGMVGWGPGAMQAARNAAGGQAAQGAGAGQAGAQHKVKEQLQGDRASQGKEQGEQEEESEEEEDSEEEDGEETEEDESIGGPHAWMWALIRKAFSMPLRTAGAKTGRDRAAAARKALEKKGARSTSRFRGVTHHIRTNRWEAHIWEEGKQVYLGGFDSEEQAALAYDLAAIRCRGSSAVTNYEYNAYEAHLDKLSQISKDGLIQELRSQSRMAAAARPPPPPRPTSIYKGVSQHPKGKWEAKSSALDGSPRHLGLFTTEAEAAMAYDQDQVMARGRWAKTNFHILTYRHLLSKEDVEELIRRQVTGQDAGSGERSHSARGTGPLERSASTASLSNWVGSMSLAQGGAGAGALQGDRAKTKRGRRPKGRGDGQEEGLGEGSDSEGGKAPRLRRQRSGPVGSPRGLVRSRSAAAAMGSGGGGGGGFGADAGSPREGAFSPATADGGAPGKGKGRMIGKGLMMGPGGTHAYRGRYMRLGQEDPEPAPASTPQAVKGSAVMDIDSGDVLLLPTSPPGSARVAFPPGCMRTALCALDDWPLLGQMEDSLMTELVGRPAGGGAGPGTGHAAGTAGVGGFGSGGFGAGPLGGSTGGLASPTAAGRRLSFGTLASGGAGVLGGAGGSGAGAGGQAGQVGLGTGGGNAGVAHMPTLATLLEDPDSPLQPDKLRAMRVQHAASASAAVGGGVSRAGAAPAAAAGGAAGLDAGAAAAPGGSQPVAVIVPRRVAAGPRTTQQSSSPTLAANPGHAHVVTTGAAAAPSMHGQAHAAATHAEHAVAPGGGVGGYGAAGASDSGAGAGSASDAGMGAGNAAALLPPGPALAPLRIPPLAPLNPLPPLVPAQRHPLTRTLSTPTFTTGTPSGVKEEVRRGSHGEEGTGPTLAPPTPLELGLSVGAAGHSPPSWTASLHQHAHQHQRTLNLPPLSMDGPASAQAQLRTHHAQHNQGLRGKQQSMLVGHSQLANNAQHFHPQQQHYNHQQQHRHQQELQQQHEVMLVHQAQQAQHAQHAHQQAQHAQHDEEHQEEALHLHLAEMWGASPTAAPCSPCFSHFLTDAATFFAAPAAAHGAQGAGLGNGSTPAAHGDAHVAAAAPAEAAHALGTANLSGAAPGCSTHASARQTASSSWHLEPSRWAAQLFLSHGLPPPSLTDESLHMPEVVEVKVESHLQGVGHAMGHAPTPAAVEAQQQQHQQQMEQQCSPGGSSSASAPAEQPGVIHMLSGPAAPALAAAAPVAQLTTAAAPHTRHLSIPSQGLAGLGHFKPGAMSVLNRRASV